jgi:hypothetical protein
MRNMTTIIYLAAPGHSNTDTYAVSLYMKHQVNIKHIKNLNNDGLRGIEFYNIELGILQGRLQEIASDNTAEKVQAEVDQFQDQFMIHGNYLNALKHDIHVNDRNIAVELLVTKDSVNEHIAAEHGSIHERFVNEEIIFNDLRHKFNRFAAEWL